MAGGEGFEPSRCIFMNHRPGNNRVRLPIPPPPINKTGFLSRTRITGNLCLRDDRQPRPAYKASRIARGLFAAAITITWCNAATTFTFFHNITLLI